MKIFTEKVNKIKDFGYDILRMKLMKKLYEMHHNQSIEFELK